MLIAIFPLVFAIVGALMYALCANTKLQTMGLWVFVCGFFWLTYALAGKTLSLG